MSAVTNSPEKLGRDLDNLRSRAEWNEKLSNISLIVAINGIVIMLISLMVMLFFSPCGHVQDVMGIQALSGAGLMLLGIIGGVVTLERRIGMLGELLNLAGQVIPAAN